ncbi:MAG: DUF2334 domain-containing protein [Candidatus Korarchaeota archaeon]|nr:DUF2334 domain-containing protein [Candidatus Korarchaeota archaeon]
MKMREEIALLIISTAIISLLLLHLHLSIGGSGKKSSRTIVIFRMDDPQPDWKENMLKRAINLFASERVPVTLGVIPKPLNKSSISQHPSFIIFIHRLAMKKGSFEIAQHGYTHMVLTKYGGSSEFGGLPLRTQMDLMRDGRDILETVGFRPITFIPPFDTYDSNTIRAAKELGFKVFSARYSNESDPGWPVMMDGIVLINAATSLTKDWEEGSVRSFIELKNAFDRVYERGGVFVLEMHYYRFDDKTIATIRELIHYMKEKDVAFMTLGEFGTGYLKGTIRREGDMWIIGNVNAPSRG